MMVINKGSRILQVVYMRNSVAGCRSPKLGLHTEKEGLLGRLLGYTTPEGGTVSLVSGAVSCQSSVLLSCSLGFLPQTREPGSLGTEGHPHGSCGRGGADLADSCAWRWDLYQGLAWVPRFRAVQSGLGPLTPAPRLSPACSPPASTSGAANP